MSETNSYESRHEILTRVKHDRITTENDAILVPYSFNDQCNMLKSITKQKILIENFKLFGESS